LHAKVDDVNELVEDIQKKAEGTPAAKLPLFMAGHSTGGLVAVYVVMQAPADRFKGLLLHSPCLDVEWTMALK
jgi:alpha-beta hydrolase superfamily lysophospholipase